MEYFNNRLFQAGLWFVSDLFYDNDKLIPFNIWMKRGVLAQDYMERFSYHCEAKICEICKKRFK